MGSILTEHYSHLQMKNTEAKGIKGCVSNARAVFAVPVSCFHLEMVDTEEEEGSGAS